MKNFEFVNVGKAMTEVWRLEEQLGIERSTPIFQIKRANEKVQELRTRIGAAVSAAPTREQRKANAENAKYEHLAEAARQRTIEAATAILRQPEPGFDADTLAAMIDSVWGKGAAAAACPKGAIKCNFASEAHKQASETKPDTYYGNAARKVLDAELKQAIAERDREHEASRFDNLRKFLHSAGVKVPGLSYAGLTVGRNPEYHSAKDIEFAQKGVNSFLAVINGEEDSARDSSSVARAARQFMVKRTGNPYAVATVGQKLETKKL